MVELFEEGHEKKPLCITPNQLDCDLMEWIGANGEWIEERLLERGGLLFRGFAIPSLDVFEQFALAFSPQLEEYRERSTPRIQVQRNIYTSTEYPANEQIPLHNENSYASNWPLKIFFHCVKNAESGGETPIADSRDVFNFIYPVIRQKFMDKGVMYVRNHGGKIDLPWQDVYQTNDKSEVEAFCKGAGITCEWLDQDRLRTKSVKSAVAKHPKTGEMVWFNQAHLFHISNLPSAVGQYLIAKLGEENLPRNVYYGDGEPIESHVLDEVRSAYQRAMIKFPWQEGDILLLDNLLMAHGRSSYKGTRKLVVAMGELSGDYGVEKGVLV